MGLHISHTPTIIGTKLEKTQMIILKKMKPSFSFCLAKKNFKKENENSYAA